MAVYKRAAVSSRQHSKSQPLQPIFVTILRKSFGLGVPHFNMNSFTAFCSAMLILACQVYGRPQESTTANATASASPPKAEGNNVTLVKNEVTPLDGKGAFSYDIELSDGTKLMQSGHTEAPGMGETEPSIVIEGSYAYVAPDGKQISITYVADKNGFQPKGDAIPTQGSSSSNATAASESPAASSPAPSAAPAASTSASTVAAA